ncbi:MAG: hypothetical protein LBD42_08460 [Desulfovibrio sp.]|jgi:hypothetical protein|nr:hypothetical protein [Desulfovibrio sp.]
MSDQFISISTMIKSRFRMVQSADAPRLYAGCPHSGNAALLEEMPAARQNETLAMVRLLAEMDRKLDAIMGLLQRDRLVADFPDEGHVVQIGGSGLVLECRYPLKKDDYMELLLSLEEIPLRLLSVIARVDDVRPDAPITGESNKAYIMTYGGMEDENREKLIRFVFSEQRKRIRQRKSSGDDIQMR